MADKRLQRIMAEDERLFRAMQPGQVAKGAAAIRGSEKPSPKKTAKKKSQKRVEKGVSRFDVFSFGVVDAIQRAMAPVSPPVREAIEEVEAGADVKQGQTDTPAVQAVSQKASGSQEGPPSSSVDSKSREPQRDAEPDYSLSESDLPEDIEFEFAQEEPDVNAGFSQTMDPIDVQGGSDLGLDDFSFESPVVKEVQALADPEIKSDVKIPLVQKRRERAQKERQAADENFQQQQQAPILGIPNPVPMQHADQDQGIDMAVNPEEGALVIDESVNAASALMRGVVDLMDKFAEEMQALSVRVRNIELVLDRL